MWMKIYRSIDIGNYHDKNIMHTDVHWGMLQTEIDMGGTGQECSFISSNTK